MKTILKIGVFVFGLSFFGLSGFATPKNQITEIKNQDQKTITGVYDGKEDYGYNFVYKNSDGEERTMTFQVVEADVLKAHDLESDALIGAHFSITYMISTETVMDENDFEEEVETKTIIKLNVVD